MRDGLRSGDKALKELINEQLQKDNGGCAVKKSFENFKEALKTSIAERHELNVRITDPKKPLEERTSDNSVVVHRWTATIEIENPSAKNQKIHIEVADIPAYDDGPG